MPQPMYAQPQMGQPSLQSDYDPVFTGHATDKVQVDQRLQQLMPTLVQKYGQRSDSPDGMMTQSAGLLDYLRKGGFDALQQSAAHARVLGADPLSFHSSLAKQKESQMSAALQLRKSLMDEYKFLGESMGGRPEDILQSFNTDPAFPNQFYIPERMGMAEEGMEGKMIPGQRRGADPATVARLRQIRESMGIGNTPMIQGGVPLAAAQRIAELQARQGGAAAPSSGVAVSPESLNRSGVPAWGPLRYLAGIPDYFDQFSEWMARPSAPRPYFDPAAEERGRRAAMLANPEAFR